MLPEGFHWAPRWQHDDGPNAIYCAGQVVAFMDRKVGGEWFARLDCQSGGPVRLRDCSSREQGRAGCEAWICRHQDRLRTEAEAQAAKAACRYWLGGTLPRSITPDQ